ncbi:partitioning defective 3-like B isoform X1 [Silurus meridionalis]|nr:partitioning defective 3-like B isoform X1 [Silurus meridionalis]
MKVTVNFGRTGVVVPCKDDWIVRDLIDQATQRYKKVVEQDGEFLVRTHHVEYADGGILDPDDMLMDLLEDKDKLIAVYEEMALQPRTSVSPGGSVASGYSSPYASEPELGHLLGHLRPALGTEIEVTSSTLKSNTPLMVRSSSELVLSHSMDTETRDTRNDNNRPTAAAMVSVRTVQGHVLQVKSGFIDTPKGDMNQRMNNSSSSLTRTVEFSSDMGPLGIKVVPYLSSLSGRALGLHVRGIEENSRTKKEGIFEEDECIVRINDTELIDKSFAQSQEMFRQAMSSPVVRLEVVPMCNKLQYEKSLISHIFSGFDSSQAVTPKPKSPFLARKADFKVPDPAPTLLPSSLTPPPREDPAVRRSPVAMERRKQTTPSPASASPTPRSRSESPASTGKPALTALANANKKSGHKMINLTKGPDGLGFTVVTRDSVVHGPGPILVKSILPRGAAVKDGRLQSGDRILQVNGVDISGYRQEELVAMLRSTKQGETISLLVSRQEELFLPRELKGEVPGPILSEDGREQLMYEIPLNDSGSAGLGDGRLRVNDQLVAVNDESLLGRSNNDAMETLRRSMSMEGNLRGTIQLIILRAMEQSPTQPLLFERIVARIACGDAATRRDVGAGTRCRNAHVSKAAARTVCCLFWIVSWRFSRNEKKAAKDNVFVFRGRAERRQDGGQIRTRETSPALQTQNTPSNGIAQHPMVINSLYERVPGPVPTSNGRPGVYDDDSEEDGFPSPPSDLETEFSPQQRYMQIRPERELPTRHQLPQTQRHPERYSPKTSKSMDLVADEGNIGARRAQRPAPATSLGPTLGLQKSSSLESLQSAMEEASKGSVPFHRPAGPMVRGRGCNMSFRQAIDKSYDGPSEPEDDFSEDSSGRETPASGSSRQGLEDGGKEKKKKTKRKKEKKTKAKKKDDADDPDKKTKKKGFGLLSPSTRCSIVLRRSGLCDFHSNVVYMEVLLKQPLFCLVPAKMHVSFGETLVLHDLSTIRLVSKPSTEDMMVQSCEAEWSASGALRPSLLQQQQPHWPKSEDLIQEDKVKRISSDFMLKHLSTNPSIPKLLSASQFPLDPKPVSVAVPLPLAVVARMGKVFTSRLQTLTPFARSLRSTLFIVSAKYLLPGPPSPPSPRSSSFFSKALRRRFGKKKSKLKLGSLSEEELNKSEPEMSEGGVSVYAPPQGNLPEVEDDDFDPNYARISNFRDPPPSNHATYPSHMVSPNAVRPAGHAYNISPTNEDPREGLYAKVNKIKTPTQPAAESSKEVRLQQIRSQLQNLKPSPAYGESGAGHRLQEYDPSRIRGPDPRMAPRYEDIDRQYTSRELKSAYQRYGGKTNLHLGHMADYDFTLEVMAAGDDLTVHLSVRRCAIRTRVLKSIAKRYETNRARTPVEAQRETDRYPSPPYNANQNPPPGPNRVPVSRPGPFRYDRPPASSPDQQGVPSYEAAVKAGTRSAASHQYGAYEDGQYPNHRTKNPPIGAV